MKRIFVVIAFFVTLLAGWELLARVYAEMLFILPPPSKIFAAIWSRPDRFFLHTRVTVTEMVAGFLLAAGAALPAFRATMGPLILPHWPKAAEDANTAYASGFSTPEADNLQVSRDE